MLEYYLITKKDLKQVYNLASEIWNENYNNIISQEQIDYMLNMMYSEKSILEDLKNNFIWELIIFKNEPIGFLSYIIKEKNRIFLSKIYLKTNFQGLGYGKESLKRVTDYAKSKKCSFVYLTVNKNNKKAIRAYNNSDFKIIKSQITDIGNGYVMDDYVFEYSI